MLLHKTGGTSGNGRLDMKSGARVPSLPHRASQKSSSSTTPTATPHIPQWHLPRSLPATPPSNTWVGPLAPPSAPTNLLLQASPPSAPNCHLATGSSSSASVVVSSASSTTTAASKHASKHSGPRASHTSPCSPSALSSSRVS